MEYFGYHGIPKEYLQNINYIYITYKLCHTPYKNTYRTVPLQYGPPKRTYTHGGGWDAL